MQKQDRNLDKRHQFKKLKGVIGISQSKSTGKERISKFAIKVTTPDAPVLRVSHLTKKFGDFVAVSNVSFDVQKGERIAIIGANGAGKTTLSEIIAGLSKPTSGTIEYGFEFKESPQEGIGMQFQKSDYPSGLTVKDMVMFADNLRKLKTPHERLDQLLETFQMEDFYKRKAKNLSGGQKQKLNILMSVLHKPRLIILDELSTGLDISAREEIINFTDDLLKNENMSAIMISHHFDEIEQICTRVVAMDHGKIAKIDTIANIQKTYGSLEGYAKTLIDEGNVGANANSQIQKNPSTWSKISSKLSLNNKKPIKNNNKPNHAKTQINEGNNTTGVKAQTPKKPNTLKKLSSKLSFGNKKPKSKSDRA